MPEDSTDRTRGEDGDRRIGGGLPPLPVPPARERAADPGRAGAGLHRDPPATGGRSPGSRDPGGASPPHDDGGRQPIRDGGGVPAVDRPRSGETALSNRAAPPTRDRDHDDPGTDRADADPIDRDGRVYLVGAGPGDPELLTRRAWALTKSADVVFHDSLTGDRIVERIPDPVDVVDVGKRPPDRTSQDEIHDAMLERSRNGDRVVRLKGGDPTVFGRGGEEAQVLAEAGIDFEIVPGISSVVAAPSVSGIPLTHRDRASSLTVITGHETPDKDESALDWSALAGTVTAGGTLVILMGVRRLPENVEALRGAGVDPDTPAAMVQKATWSDERTVVGTLRDIVPKARAASIEPPAVTVVGDVVAVHDDVAERLLG